MLSPSMMTKSKATFWRYSSICFATSYCSRSPVPLSPMTAKRTDFSCRGSFRPGEFAFCGLAAASAGETPQLKLLPHRPHEYPTAPLKTPKNNMTGSSHGNCACAVDFGNALRRRDGIGDKVDDQIGHHVMQRQIAPHNPVFKLFWQPG